MLAEGQLHALKTVVSASVWPRPKIPSSFGGRVKSTSHTPRGITTTGIDVDKIAVEANSAFKESLLAKLVRGIKGLAWWACVDEVECSVVHMLGVFRGSWTLGIILWRSIG